MNDTISRQAAIELFKDDIYAVNELNNLPPVPDRMKYVQEAVHTIMNTCKSDSIKDKAFRNAARLIQNAIDGEAPDFEEIEELPSAQQKKLKYSGESICLRCQTKGCDGCLFEPMEGVCSKE